MFIYASVADILRMFIYASVADILRMFIMPASQTFEYYP